VKPKIDGPTKNSTNIMSTTHSTKRQHESKKIRITSRVPMAKGVWSRRKEIHKQKSPSWQ
jgi:hypothetical protein